MTPSEREALKRRVDAARRSRLKRSAPLTYGPRDSARPEPVDTVPMCEARVGLFALRNAGAPCPWHALPGERLCGVHLRLGEADLRSKAEREAAAA